MILDSLENSKRIECIHPLFKQAFDYVKSTDFSKMEDGKYDIADAGFTVSIARLFGKEKSEAAIETHKKFIDIQFPLLGVEKIGWKPGDQLQEESVSYNEEQDIAFISTNLPPIRKSIPDNSPFISRKTGTPRVSAKGISGRWLSRSRSNNIEYPICSARITS